MIRKTISRTLICASIYFLIYADKNMKTIDIAMSICILLLFEISMLVKNKNIEILILIIPFIISFAIIYGRDSHQLYKFIGLIIVFLCGLFQYTCNEKLESARKQIHSIMDYGSEYSQKLIKTNRLLRIEQDREIHMAMLAERSRISREIHDNVGHMLSRAIVLLGAIRTVNKNDIIDEHLITLAETLDSAMEEMRTSVHDIHNDSIDLEKNILDIIAKIPERFNVNYDLDIDQSLNSRYSMALIAICREAVSNILKHSNGDDIQITVHEHPGFVSMMIHDNGCVSIKTREMLEMNKDTGIGLTNIISRVEELKGNIHISGESGFKIFLTIPKV